MTAEITSGAHTPVKSSAQNRRKAVSVTVPRDSLSLSVELAGALVAIRDSGLIEVADGDRKRILSQSGNDLPLLESLAALKCVVKGLGDGEYISRRWVFDGEWFAEISRSIESAGNGAVSLRYRSVCLQKPGEGKKTWVAVPLIQGTLVTVAFASIVRLDTTGSSRLLTSDRTGLGFTLKYLNPDGTVEGETDILDSEFFSPGEKGSRWLTRLALTPRISLKRIPMVRELARSVINRDRDSGEVPPKATVRETGLIQLPSDGKTVFGLPTGTVSAEGPVSLVNADPPKNSYRSMPHGRFRVSDERSGIAEGYLALAEMAKATKSPTALFLLGDVASAPFASLYDSARGVTIIQGESLKGKTSLASMMVSVQSPNLDPRDDLFSLRLRQSANGRGSATDSGIRVRLSPWAGVAVITDDLVKKGVAGAEYSNAVNVLSKLVMQSDPGASAPAQATIDRTGDEGVVAAEIPEYRNRVVVTTEMFVCDGPLQTDSIHNRTLNLTHRGEDRCDSEVWQRLQNPDQTRTANVAWSDFIRWVCGHHAEWVTELGKVEAALIPMVAEARLRHRYAIRITGLVMLARSASVHDVNLAHLQEAAYQGVEELLRREVEHSSATVENRAAYSLIDSVLENVRRVVKASGHFSGEKMSGVEADSYPVITGDPEEDEEKYGITQESIGWRVGQDEREEPIGSRIGYVKLMDKQSRVFPGELCIVSAGSDYQEFVDRINASAKRNDQRTGTRTEFTEALTSGDGPIGSQYRVPKIRQRGVVIRLAPLLIESLDSAETESE